MLAQQPNVVRIPTIGSLGLFEQRLLKLLLLFYGWKRIIIVLEVGGTFVSDVDEL